MKCHYCGATVLVPPRLGGAVQRCPNHPESLAVGFCNTCKKAFCDKCLYISRSLYLCLKCLKAQRRAIAYVLVAYAFFILICGLFGESQLSGAIIIFLFLAFLIGAAIVSTMPPSVTVYEKIKASEAKSTKEPEELY